MITWDHPRPLGGPGRMSESTQLLDAKMGKTEQGVRLLCTIVADNSPVRGAAGCSCRNPPHHASAACVLASMRRSADGYALKATVSLCLRQCLLFIFARTHLPCRDILFPTLHLPLHLTGPLLDSAEM